MLFIIFVWCMTQVKHAVQIKIYPIFYPHKIQYESAIVGLKYQCRRLVPVLLLCINCIPAWITNCMPSEAWDEVIHSFPNCNGATIEVWELMSMISNYSPHFIMGCDYLSMPGLKLIHLSKSGPGSWLCCGMGLLPRAPIRCLSHFEIIFIDQLLDQMEQTAWSNFKLMKLTTVKKRQIYQPWISVTKEKFYTIY